MFISSFLSSASSPRSKVEPDLSKLYQMKQLIGKGGNGHVYAGIRKADGKEVAIKRIKKSQRVRLKGNCLPKEVYMLRRLNGTPGVISILDYFESAGSHYIVMERLQGSDLFDFVSSFQQGLPERVTKEIFRQVVKVVYLCHMKGVVHGDIKDENIVIDTKTKEVKLVDFGSSGFWSEEAHSQYLGTREYAPPEWFSFHQVTNEGVTVWSLGILLYSLLFRDIPFQTVLQICQESPSIPFKVSPSCASLLEGCLDKELNSRFTMSQVISHPWLDNFSFSEPVYV